MPFPDNRSMRLARFYGNPEYALDTISSKSLSGNIILHCIVFAS
jgi:hypothetical protein